MSFFSITTLAVGQLNSNCYIFSDKKGNCVVIDPGDDGQFIIETLQRNQLTPHALLATHGHFDHVNAALELQLAYNIPFFLSQKDHFFLTENRASTIHFTGNDPGPSAQATNYPNESTIAFPFCSFTLLPVPGHTPGSVALYHAETKSIFVGDLVFANGSVGEWHHRYSDQKTLHQSIQRILSLPSETVVYPGHDEQISLHSLKPLYESQQV